jgi:hypothetical protein
MKRLTLGCLVLVASAALAEETAAEISKNSRERGALNLVNLSAELKLTTTAADGKTKDQTLTTSSKNVGGKNHALSRFSEPAAVAGVAFLTIEGGPGEADDISLYLPKLKRVRKVAKTERGKAFMDTDFSYADIASNGSRDEDMKRLPDEKVEGRDCFLIAGKGGEDSPYSEVKIWVDKKTWVPMKAEYADKAGKPFKRYRTLKLKAFKDRTIAAESVMENLQANTKTQMQVLKLEDAATSDDAYTERALERG